MDVCGCIRGLVKLSASAGGEATLLTPPPSPSWMKTGAFAPAGTKKFRGATGTVPADMCCRAQGSGAPPGDCRAALKGDLLLLGCKDTGDVLFARVMAGARVSVQGDTVSVSWDSFPTLTMRIWCNDQAERWGWELKAASNWATERNTMYSETMSSAHLASQSTLRQTKRQRLQLREPVWEDQASNGNLTCSDESVFSQSISDDEMNEEDCWFSDDTPSDSELLLGQPDSVSMEQPRLSSSSSVPSSPTKPRRRPPLPPKSPHLQECQEASDDSGEHAAGDSNASSCNEVDQAGTQFDELADENDHQVGRLSKVPGEFPDHSDALMRELEWTQAELAKKSALAEAEQQKAAEMESELERLCGLVTKQREKAEILLANRPKPKMQACMRRPRSEARRDQNLLPTVQQPQVRQDHGFAPTVQELEAQQDHDLPSTVQLLEAQKDHDFATSIQELKVQRHNPAIQQMVPTVQEPRAQQDHELPPAAQQLEAQQDQEKLPIVQGLEAQQHHKLSSTAPQPDTQLDRNCGPTVQELEAQQDHDLAPTVQQVEPQQDPPESYPDVCNDDDGDCYDKDDARSESEHEVSDLEAYVDERMARTSELMALFSREQKYLDQAADELAGRRLLAKQEADSIDALEAEDAEHNEELVQLETWVDKLFEHYESGATSQFLDAPENAAFEAKLLRSESLPIAGTPGKQQQQQQQLSTPVSMKRDSSLPSLPPSPRKLRQGIRPSLVLDAKAPVPIKGKNGRASMPGRLGPSET